MRVLCEGRLSYRHAARLPAIAVMAGAMLGSGTAAATTGSITGKVWVVSVDRAANATFPAPGETPDATFTTNGIAYIGTQVGIHNNHCYTIARFVADCGTPGYGLTFSGLPNPHLGGAAANAKTAMSGRGYGVMIEFTGTAGFTSDKPIDILHDDGISLKIDGSVVPGFGSGVTGPQLDEIKFTGTTGSHAFDLLYANAEGGGAWLIFFPQLY
jgi:hypothetical protein